MQAKGNPKNNGGAFLEKTASIHKSKMGMEKQQARPQTKPFLAGQFSFVIHQIVDFPWPERTSRYNLKANAISGSSQNKLSVTFLLVNVHKSKDGHGLDVGDAAETDFLMVAKSYYAFVPRQVAEAFRIIHKWLFGRPLLFHYWLKRDIRG